jgi:hypothetical protein
MINDRNILQQRLRIEGIFQGPYRLPKSLEGIRLGEQIRDRKSKQPGVDAFPSVGSVIFLPVSTASSHPPTSRKCFAYGLDPMRME